MSRPVRIPRAALMAVVVSLGAGALTVAAGQGVDSLVRAFMKKETKQSRSALLRFASDHPKDRDGALALLAVGASKATGDDHAQSIPRLQSARDRLTAIPDYPAYYLAEAHYRAKDWKSAVKELEVPVYSSLASPLRARAVVLAGKVYLESGAPGEGVKLLREFAKELPQPEGLHILARCLEADGDLTGAVKAYQRIYYEYPKTDEARDAAKVTARLHRRMGRSYPLASAGAKFTQVQRLMDKRLHTEARKELQDLTSRLRGADQDKARVWLGKARYIRGHDSVAHRWLKSLKVSSKEADAERLYYLLASARRLRRTGDVRLALRDLKAKYPSSPWRLEALVSAGNMYLLVNDHKSYVPIYAECAKAFPNHERGAYCDWKVAWSSYIRRLPDAEEKLRGHVEGFPASVQASAALYFLGRIAERRGDKAVANTWYGEIVREYPNFYYAGVARQRIRDGELAGESADVKAFLSQVTFPVRNHKKEFDASTVTSARLERARMLMAGGLDGWAETELRFAARHGAQGPVLAMELARVASTRGEFGKSLRYIKALAPGYLSIELESAPKEFWDLSFPMVYREQIEKYGARRNLDLNMLAALIRQESEFDRRAVSRARAYGLMQVLPSTGRTLARKVGVRGFKTSHLYSPDININMGTYYLRSLIDELDGHTEAALASYNAGKSRAVRWLTWGDFREPSEFIETIPFTETRTYVQTVLRNAEVYRRLYGASGGVTAKLR